LKRRTPRGDAITSVLPDSDTALSPPSSFVYVFSNAMVGHAARVHASNGPATSVWPVSVYGPLQLLQSARVDSAPLVKVTV
jgi:hypothetical protein